MLKSPVELCAQKNRQALLVCLLLAAVTLAVFWPVRLNDFLSQYDDQEYVTANPQVQRGLSREGLAWAFQTGHAANWHPLTWLSHMLDVQLFGLNPAGHHLTNLLFHLANAMLIFLLLSRTTGATWRSAFVAALFAVHPLHVESVVWVAERKDVLSTFFGLLAIWAYTSHANAEGKRQNAEGKAQHCVPRFTFHASRFYLLSLLLFAFSLMSKPMLVTLPFLLLLLDYWPLRRLQFPTRNSSPAGRFHPSPLSPQLSDLLYEKAPFFVLSLASSVTTFLAQRAGEAVVPLDHYPFQWRLLYALMGYWGYLKKTVWPSGLSFLYLPHPWPWWQFVLASLVLMGTTALALGAARSRPYLAVGWLWYVVSLVPVIGLVQVGNQSMADRYTYVPLIGCFIILAWGGQAFLKNRPAARLLLTTLPALAILGCMLGTARQLRHWRSSEALFEQAIKSDARHFVAHNLLANVLVTQKRFEEAEAHYVAALNLRPDYADGYVNRGFGLAQRGRTEEALTNYLFALQLKPEHFAARKNLGALLAEQGKLDEAIAQFAEAARLAPNDPAAHYNLGTALLSQQRSAEAAAHLATSLQLKPGDLETRRNLALALMGQGRTAEAISHLALVAVQRPAAESHYELAEALLRQARSQEAAGHLRAALALKPDWMPALNNLAWILATHPDSKVRNGPEAVRLARRACELSSGTNGSLLATLAAAYAEAGQFEDAVNAARKVRDLALAAGDRQAADAAQERITLYESRKTCRQQ